jgi:hypothetical protein
MIYRESSSGTYIAAQPRMLKARSFGSLVEAKRVLKSAVFLEMVRLIESIDNELDARIVSGSTVLWKRLYTSRPLSAFAYEVEDA